MYVGYKYKNLGCFATATKRRNNTLYFFDAQKMLRHFHSLMKKRQPKWIGFSIIYWLTVGIDGWGQCLSETTRGDKLKKVDMINLN